MDNIYYLKGVGHIDLCKLSVVGEISDISPWHGGDGPGDGFGFKLVNDLDFNWLYGGTSEYPTPRSIQKARAELIAAWSAVTNEAPRDRPDISSWPDPRIGFMGIGIEKEDQR